MAEILSRSEMDSLLAAPDLQTRTRTAPQSSPVRAESLRALHAIHEGFAGELSTSLSGLLRLPVDVRLISIDQVSYGELMLGLESPTCLSLIQVTPLEGSWLLELNPSIAFPLVDRLLGGGGDLSEPVPHRPLTDIETRMLTRITDRIAAALRSAWSDVCELTTKQGRVGSDPRSLSFVAREAMVVVVSLDVSIGEAVGMLNLCLPSRTLASLEGRLAAGLRNQPQTVDRGATESVSTEKRQGGIELIVELASTRLTAEEVAHLAVGDVIVTGCEPGQPLVVRLDGDPRFTGFAGLVKGRKAVRIDSARSPLNPRQIPPSPANEGPAMAGAADRDFVEGD